MCSVSANNKSGDYTLSLSPNWRQSSPLTLIIQRAEHESAAAWLAAATKANSGISAKKLETREPQLVKPFNKNDRIRRTSILRQSPPVISNEALVVSPTSPTEKKNVRFADSMGGQLESVKYYVISPQIRRRHSSMAAPFMYNQFYNRDNNQRCSLVPTNFSNPSLSFDFNNKLVEKSVLLHSITTAETTVYGIISVVNHTFIKKVFVRYTYNDWKTHSEVEANYMLGSHEGQTDKFSFAIYSKPNDFSLSSPDLFHPRLYFVIRFLTGDGKQFWDNNDGNNYCLNFLVSELLSLTIF